VFEKRWAAALLELVLKKMREEFILSGKAELFEAIKPYLWSEGPATSFSQLAVQLNMTLVAVKVTVHRLRHRYRDLLRTEIAHTVATPGEVDDEIRRGSGTSRPKHTHSINGDRSRMHSADSG
jgi:RNA polymerase sigma-70 factor (ECF subfamily)